MQQDNKEYLFQFDATNRIPEKLILIKEKLIRDKVVFPDSCRSTSKISEYKFVKTFLCNQWKYSNGEVSGKKILHFVFYKKGKLILQLDDFLYPVNSKIIEYLNQTNTYKIEKFDEDFTTALFGTYGKDTNSIVIYTDDKKIKKLIKKILREN